MVIFGGGFGAVGSDRKRPKPTKSDMETTGNDWVSIVDGAGHLAAVKRKSCSNLSLFVAGGGGRTDGARSDGGAERRRGGVVCSARSVVLGHSGTFWDSAVGLFCAGAMGCEDGRVNCARFAGMLHGVAFGCMGAGRLGGETTRAGRRCRVRMLGLRITGGVARAGRGGRNGNGKGGFFGGFRGKDFWIGVWRGCAREVMVLLGVCGEH